MMSDRKGIEIDFCPSCRGVWLDKGELDKIIELSINERFASHSGRQSGNHHYDNRASRHHNDYYGHKKPYHKYKKRKSIMGEIFDIFD